MEPALEIHVGEEELWMGREEDSALPHREGGGKSDRQRSTPNLPLEHPPSGRPASISRPPRREVSSHQRWVGPHCQQAIQQSRNRTSRRCTICNYKCASPSRQEAHIRRHFSRMFCRCGFNAGEPVGIRRHHQAMARHGKGHKHGDEIFKVDSQHYEQWARYVGLSNPPPFRGPSTPIQLRMVAAQIQLAGGRDQRFHPRLWVQQDLRCLYGRSPRNPEQQLTSPKTPQTRGCYTD